MKKISKKVGSALIAGLLFAAILTPSFSGFTATQVCNCDPPSGLTISMPASSHVSFSWDSSEQGENYEVWNYRMEDNYTSAVRSTSNSYINYNDLPAGTYTFYFTTICNGGARSQTIVYDDLIIF